MTLPAIAAHAAAACAPKLCDKLWQIFNKGDGTATIKLDGPYELRLNEKSSEIRIVNSKTHEETRIWGDPHVDYNKDGKNDFDFWGTTTFKLEDGTKITINTEPWKGNKNMYVANNIVVTKGEQSLVIDGLSQNKHGDLKIHQGLNGHKLDRLTPDGNLTLRENPNGVGWLNEQGQMVTQHDGNRTKIDPHKPPPKAPDFCKQLETMFHRNEHHGSIGRGHDPHGPGWHYDKCNRGPQHGGHPPKHDPCKSPKAPDFRHPIEIQPFPCPHDAGKVGKGKGKGGDSWYAAMARALGEHLDKQAGEISRLSDIVSKPGGKDDPSNMTHLTTASQRMGFIANGSMTAINSVGEALSTMARKG